LPIRAAVIAISWRLGCSDFAVFDYERIKQIENFVGFSDLLLTLVINARTHLVTFHGPNGLTSWKPAQTEYFCILKAANPISNLKDPTMTIA